MNLQAPRAFSRREKIIGPESIVCSLESLGSKPIEVCVERVATIPSLSSFGESTTVASGESSIEASFSDSLDSYESLGVISRLEDFIAREIGHVMDDSNDDDDDEEYAGEWAHAAFSQDFSVLPSKKDIVKPSEWRQKRGGTVNDILECSLDRSSSLLTTDTVPSQIDRKGGVCKDIDLKVAASSLVPSLSQSDRVNETDEGEDKLFHSTDSLKKTQKTMLPTKNLLRMFSTASFGEKRRTIEFDSVRKSQSNISQRIRSKCGMLGSSKHQLNNTVIHEHTQELQTYDNAMESSRIISETNMNSDVDHAVAGKPQKQGSGPCVSRGKPLGWCLSPLKPPTNTLPGFVSKIIKNNTTEGIGPQVSFHDTVIEYQIDENYSGSDCADDKNCHDEEFCWSQEQQIKEVDEGGNKDESNLETSNEEGENNDQQTSTEEAREPGGTQLQAHKMEKISNLVLMTSKFPSIRTCLQARKKKFITAPKEAVSSKGDNRSSEEKDNSKSQRDSVANIRIADRKETQIRKRTKDWKTKLFKGPDGVKRQTHLSCADEVCSPSQCDNGEDGHCTVRNSFVIQGLLNTGAEDQTPHFEPSNGCLASESHCRPLVLEIENKKEVSLEPSTFKEEEHQIVEKLILSGNTLLESGESQDWDEFGKSSSIDIGQEVVGDFGSRLNSPTRNLGGFLRRPFRKRKTVSTPWRDTLIEPYPIKCDGKELNSEGKSKAVRIPATISNAAESSKSGDDKSPCIANPERHEQHDDISKAVKLEIRRLIRDMATIRNIENTKKGSKTQSAKSLKMLVSLDKIVKERSREDNEKNSRQRKSFILFGVADDFSNIFSCPCQGQ